MRVLMLGAYPPPYGGLQVHVVALRRFLRARDIPCSFINLDRHRNEERDDVYYPSSGWGVLSLLLRLRYDIVHQHVGGALSKRHMMLAFVCTLLPRTKTVFTLHSGGYPSSPEGRSLTPRSPKALILRRLDRVIAVNREGAEFFERIGVPRARIRTIAPHAFSAPDAERVSGGDRRALIGNPLDDFVRLHEPLLLSVGLLEPEYNIDLQIDAFAGIRERFPNAGLVIIGSGSLHDRLEEQIAAHPDAAHIALCGDVPHDATLRMIAEADVLLRTTSYDGDAISIREALYFGTHVLATDNGMRPDGVTLIDRLDADDLVDDVERRLEAPSSARPEMPGDRNLGEVLALFEELTTRRPARRLRRPARRVEER